MKILNLEPYGYSPKAKAILKRIGQIDDGPLSREELSNSIKHYDVVIVRLGHNFNKEIMDAAQKLKVIVSATTGLNHIDLDAAGKRGIRVLSLKEETVFLESVHATAEHTWAIILSLIRKVPQAHCSVLVDQWNRDCFKGKELFGRSLGIIGLGRIGSKIANIGIGFGMNIFAYDIRNKTNMASNIKMLSSIGEVLPIADIISIHVEYNYNNCNLIGECEIEAMKKGAMLINTSRGEILNEKALLDGLKSGHLGGAALDVLCSECNDSNNSSKQLIEYARCNDNLIITPHIGGCTYESMEKTEIFMANKLVNYYQ